MEHTFWSDYVWRIYYLISVVGKDLVIQDTVFDLIGDISNLIDAMSDSVSEISSLIGNFGMKNKFMLS